MKKIKIIFGTLVIAFGVAGAFATHATNHKTLIKDDDGGFYWYSSTSGSGASSVNSVPETRAQRITATGCNGAATFCEKGYDGDQLNTEDVPSSGVKTGQLNLQQDEIFHQ
jgi:hypothetical protein